MEAEFAIDERSALSLYDCLVPRIKEHRRSKINMQDKFSINELKELQYTKELELELQRSQMPKLMEENGLLYDKVKQLED